MGPRASSGVSSSGNMKRLLWLAMFALCACPHRAPAKQPTTHRTITRTKKRSHAVPTSGTYQCSAHWSPCDCAWVCIDPAVDDLGLDCDEACQQPEGTPPSSCHATADGCAM